LSDDESAAAGSFSQFALGSVQAEGEVDESRRCQMPEDMLNGDEFDGADAYTGKMLLAMVKFFLVCSFHCAQNQIVHVFWFVVAFKS
jgi:hypothetical protein